MKSYKNQNQLLDDSIAALRLKRQHEIESLKTQYHVVLETLRPSNIIDQSITDISTAFALRGNLKVSIISILGGYLSRKLLVRNSKSLFKNILGYIIQVGVSNLITRRVDPDLRD